MLRNAKGITLLEVMIAASLVIIMSLGLLSAHLAVRHTTRLARVRLESSQVARSYLEREKSKSYSNIQSQTYNNVVLSDNGTVVVDDNVVGIVQVTVTTNADDTKTIVVAANWNHRLLGNVQNAQSVTLTSLVAEI